MSIKQARVALHAELVRPEDVSEAIHLQELVDDAGAEGIACTAGADGEVFLLGVRV
jgi:hypothetical protein